MKIFDKKNNRFKENIPLLATPNPKDLETYMLKILEDIPKVSDDIVNSFNTKNRFILIGIDFKSSKLPFFVSMREPATNDFCMSYQLDEKGFQYLPFAAPFFHSMSKECKDLCIQFEPNAIKECFVYFIIPENTKELTPEAIIKACEILKEKLEKLSLNDIEENLGIKKENESTEDTCLSCCGIS